MFVGHLALAFASKRPAGGVSLGWLMAAVSTADLIWPWLLLAGVEQVAVTPGATAFTPLTFTAYPWSHSLVTLVLWGLALAALARWRGAPSRACAIIAVLVLSHWVLDFVTHAPDMPIWPGASSPRVGLGLWNSIPLTFAIEGVMWVAGLALYLRGRRARGWIGPVALWSFVLVSTVMWATGPWSPPPPDPRSLAWFALIGWIVVPWAALADRWYEARQA
jgi:hypothetical protein